MNHSRQDPPVPGDNPPPPTTDTLPGVDNSINLPDDYSFKFNSYPQKNNDLLRQQGEGWFADYTSQLARKLNFSLVNTFDLDSIGCCVKFSKDENFLAVGCNRRVIIFEVKTLKQICELYDESFKSYFPKFIRSISFSPDGKYLATCVEVELILWDMEKKIIVHRFEGHTDDIYSLEFSRDGQFIVSCSSDHTARIWNVETKECLLTLINEETVSDSASVSSVAFSPDGSLVATGYSNNGIQLWDSRSGEKLDTLVGHTGGVISLAFSSDGKTLISGSIDKILKSWDLSAMGSKNAIPCKSTLENHKDYVLSVAYTPCNNWILSGSKDRCVRFWDSKTLQHQASLDCHKNSVISVTVSPSGSYFATGSADCKVKLWTYAK